MQLFNIYPNARPEFHIWAFHAERKDDLKRYPENFIFTRIEELEFIANHYEEIRRQYDADVARIKELDNKGV